MKFSESFTKDFNWYIKVRHMFNFDGNNMYIDKKGNDIVQYCKDGVTGKEAFFIFDSKGEIKKTKHPNILTCLLKTKGSVNLHIKMYAQDRANGNYPLFEFRAFCIKYQTPIWFKKAVENQKLKYY